MKPYNPGLVFSGSFIITDSILLIVISLFKLSISLDSHLVRYMFLESWPILLGCQICWHIIVHIILSFFFFVFPHYSLTFHLLHFLFYFSSFCFFLGESCQRFVNIVHLFKEQALGLIDFLFFFFHLYFIDFLYDLYDFLPSDDFRFVCSSFTNSFMW